MKPELFLFSPEALARQAEVARKRSQLRIRGHAGQPGDGPAGETCRSCAHYVRKELSGTYRKCGLRAKTWTGGAGTDIRAGDPACPKWEAR